MMKLRKIIQIPAIILILGLAGCGGSGSSDSGSGGGSVTSHAGVWQLNVDAVVSGPGGSARATSSGKIKITDTGQIIDLEPTPGEQLSGQVTGNTFSIVENDAITMSGVTCIARIEGSGSIGDVALSGSLRSTQFQCNGVDLTLSGTITGRRI